LEADDSGNLTEVPRDQVRWYAIYVRSRFEKKVHAGLQENKVESFLPLVEEVRKWSDRKKRIEMPLFPGYLFVRIDLRDRLRVLTVDGVVKFVGIRHHPSPVPAEQIRWVKIVIGHPEKLKREPYVSEGEVVQIVAGPFNGIRGLVQRVNKNTRVIISLDTIAQAVSVEVDPACIEPLAKHQVNAKGIA
jgi:transcription antitermination factor NusG